MKAYEQLNDEEIRGAIAKAVNASDGRLEIESRIDDIAAELYRREENRWIRN